MKPRRIMFLAASILAGAAAAQAPPPTVKTATVSRGRVARSIEAAGTLRPWRDVSLATQVPGTVTAVLCHMGQWVGQGEVLVQLDDELARIAVQEANAAVERSRAQLEQSTTDLERAQKLHATDDISDAELEALSLRRQEASAGLVAAQATLQRAQRTLRDTLIRAPFAGSVAQRMVEVGSWVTPGQPVARVVDLSRMKAEFGIPQQRTPEISVGMRATLAVDLYPGVTFPAEVYRLGVVADPASGQFALEVSVAQSTDHPLRPGMAVRLALDTQVTTDAALVPKDAVLDRGGTTYVFVVDRSRTVHLRQVELGSTSGGSRELIGGELRVGDAVVTAGKENLAEGDTVEVEVTTPR